MGMKASPRALVFVLPLLGAGGCNEPPQDSELARAVIGPRGGLLTSADSVLTIAIPPGALEEDVELFIERSDEPPEVFGRAYLVRPNPELRYDATITYRQELPDDTSGLAVGAVDVTEYEADRGRWLPLPLLRVDRRAKLVSGLDDGLSIFYALLDDADAPATSTSVGDPTGTPPATTGDDSTTGSDGGSDGDSDGGSTTASDDTGESTGEPTVSYAREVEPILVANCGCHTDGEPAGLSLTNGYANLVGVASTEVPGLARVEPGAPADSYLWHKVSGTHLDVGGQGDPMPAPTGGLDVESLAILEAWILDGAEP